MGKKKNNTKKSVLKQRNSIALNPLMKKSDIHGRSDKAARRQNRIKLLKNFDGDYSEKGQCDQQSAFRSSLLITLTDCVVSKVA